MESLLKEWNGETVIINPNVAKKIFEFDYILIMLPFLRHQEIASDQSAQPDWRS
jgi:hypothetical protein